MQTGVRILNLWPLAVQPSSVVIITPPVRPAQQCNWVGCKSPQAAFCLVSAHTVPELSLTPAHSGLWWFCDACIGSWGNATSCISSTHSLSITEGKLPLHDARQSIPLPRPYSRHIWAQMKHDLPLPGCLGALRSFVLEAPSPTPTAAKVVLEANIFWIKAWYFLGFPETVK